MLWKKDVLFCDINPLCYKFPRRRKYSADTLRFDGDMKNMRNIQQKIAAKCCFQLQFTFDQAWKRD